LGSEKFFTFIAINFVWHANFLFGKNSQDQAKSLNHHYSERERERDQKEREIFRPSLSSLFQKGNAWKQKRSPRLEEKRKISYSNSSRSSKQFLNFFFLFS
jgi:hypothetical protein